VLNSKAFVIRRRALPAARTDDSFRRMSVQQLEQSVRDLSPEELARFCEWFDSYRLALGPVEDDEPELSMEQRAEIDRRLDELDADPSLAVPWEGFKEEVLKIREEIRIEGTRRRRA